MECSIYVIGDESHLHTVAITGDCAGFDCSVASFSACEDEIMPKAPASSWRTMALPGSVPQEREGTRADNIRAGSNLIKATGRRQAAK